MRSRHHAPLAGLVAVVVALAPACGDEEARRVGDDPARQQAFLQALRAGEGAPSPDPGDALLVQAGLEMCDHLRAGEWEIERAFAEMTGALGSQERGGRFVIAAVRHLCPAQQPKIDEFVEETGVETPTPDAAPTG